MKQRASAGHEVAATLTSDAERIVSVIKRIPRGRVSTYGRIAEAAGLARRARLVGTVLRQAPDSARLPWHRVVNASGRSSFPQGSDGWSEQRRRLQAESVVFIGDRVDLRRHGWPELDVQLDELLWGPPPER